MRIISEYLLLSMFITLVVLYFLQPSPRVIVKYPNVSDKISDTYIDDNNICYKYHRRVVECETA